MSQIVEYISHFGRFQRNARLFLYSSALSGVTVGIVLVLYNLYLTSLGYGTDFIGLVLFMGTIGGALAIFPAGLCIDRFGSKQILIWASVVIGIAGTGQFLFRTPFPLLISTFLVGLAGAFVLVVTAPFLSANSTPAERPHLFSLNIVLILVTSIVGSSIGGALPSWFRRISLLMGPLLVWLEPVLAHQAEPRSYQLALLFAGLVSAPSFIPLFLLEDDRDRRSIQMHRHAVSHSSPALAIKIWQQRVCVLWQHRHETAWLRHPLVIISVMQACIGFGAGLFLPYINLYFVRHLGADLALYGLLDGFANGLYALGALLAPWLTRRIGRVATIALPRLLSIPIMIVMGLTTFLPLAVVLYPLRKMLNNMAQGIIQVFTMEKMPPEHRGLANSSYETAYWITWACAAPVGGVIIEQWGFTPVFLGAAICYTVGMGLFWLRFWHDPGHSYGVTSEKTLSEHIGPV